MLLVLHPSVQECVLLPVFIVLAVLSSLLRHTIRQIFIKALIAHYLLCAASTAFNVLWSGTPRGNANFYEHCFLYWIGKVGTLLNKIVHGVPSVSFWDSRRNVRLSHASKHTFNTKITWTKKGKKVILKSSVKKERMPSPTYLMFSLCFLWMELVPSQAFPAHWP